MNDDWVRCPSRGLEPVRISPDRCRCPLCDFTYSTVMDNPLLPDHWWNRNGDVLVRPTMR